MTKNIIQNFRLKAAAVILCLTGLATAAQAQIRDDEFDNFTQNDEGVMSRRNQRNIADSLGTDKEIPRGLKVWTVDSLRRRQTGRGRYDVAHVPQHHLHHRTKRTIQYHRQPWCTAHQPYLCGQT